MVNYFLKNVFPCFSFATPTSAFMANISLVEVLGMLVENGSGHRQSEVIMQFLQRAIIDIYCRDFGPR